MSIDGNNKKKIAVISYKYLPFNDGTVTCLKNVIIELAKNNEVDVFCRKETSQAKDTEYVDGYTIRRLAKKIDIFAQKKDYLVNKWSNIPNLAISKVLGYIIKTIFYPFSFISKKHGAYYIDSYINSFDFERTLAKYDVIICTDSTIEVIDKVCTYKENHPEKRWIFLQYDLYTNNPIFDSIERDVRIERQKRWYDLADVIVIQPEMLKYVHRDGFEIYKNKVIGLPLTSLRKIISEADENDYYNTQSKRDSNEILLVYAGTFYPDIRNPKHMLEVLYRACRRDNRLRIVICCRGCEDELHYYKKLFGDSLEVKGFIPPSELDILYKNADFLISLGNTYNEMIPSKTLEMVGYRKPIIHFAQIEDDASELYLCDYPMWKRVFIGNITNDTVNEDINVDTTAELLLTFIEESFGKVCNFKEVNSKYMRYTPAYFVGEVLDRLEINYC